MGEVAQVNYRDPTIGDLPQGTAVTFVPMAAVDAGTGTMAEPERRTLGEVRKGYTQFSEGDVLFAKITPCMENGKAAIARSLANGRGFGSTEFHVLRPEPGILPEWLFYFVRQDSFRAEAKSSFTGTAGQLRVPASFVREHAVPVAPTAEQQRIVTKIEELFSQLDAGVAALGQAKAQLHRYRRAVLKAAMEGELTREWREAHKEEVQPPSARHADPGMEHLPAQIVTRLPTLPDGWEWFRLGDVTESMRNGIYKPKEFYAPDGIACLRMYNIEDGLIVWKDIKRMVLQEGEIEDYELRVGDILLNRVNSRELVGKSAIIPPGLEQCVYESKNIRLRVRGECVDSRFANLWIQLFGPHYFSSQAQQTVGMATINQRQLGSMPMPVPPLVEQGKIVDEVDRLLSAMHGVASSAEQTLKRAERLRQAILKRAFRGKLVPQDPTDERASVLLERIKAEKARREAETKQITKKRQKKEPDQPTLFT